MPHHPRTPIDLNSASEEDLTHNLKLTPRLAKRVVLMRPYARVEDLSKVWGMDANTLTRILPLVVLGPKVEHASELGSSLPGAVEPEQGVRAESSGPIETESSRPPTGWVEGSIEPSPLRTAIEKPERVSRIWSKKIVFPLLAILLIGAFFRFAGLNWDQNQHQHPDERFLTMVAERIKPVSIGEYFHTETSTLNPLQDGAGYTYGMFPLFATRAVAKWVGMTHYDKIVLVGRVMSGLFDLAAILMLYILGATLYNRRVGLLAAALAAAAVLPIQLSHFFTVDSFSTVFILAAFYCAYRAVPILTPGVQPKWKDLLYYLAFGLVVGLAMACKINTAPLFGILIVAGVVSVGTVWKSKYKRTEAWKVVLVGVVAAGLVMAVTFRIFQPYAFQGPGFFGIQLNPRWLEVMREVTNQVAGKSEWPPNHHWTARPVTYAWTNMVMWGMGLPLGLAAWIGWAWAAWRGIKGDWRRQLLPVLWVAGYFIWQNAQFWRYMRYFIPIYPILILLAAWALVEWLDRTKASREQCWSAFRTQRISAWVWKPMLPNLLFSVVAAIIVGGTYGYAMAFTRIYNEPLTRIAASRWMIQNIRGPINIVVASGNKSQSYPIAAPADLAFYQDDSFHSSFQPLKTGDASTIRTTRVSMALGDVRVKISQDPDGKDILSEGYLVIPAKTPAERQTVHFGDVNLQAGKPYSLLFTMRTSGAMSAQQAYLWDGNQEDPQLPIDWVPSMTGAGLAQGHVEFTPSSDLRVNQLGFEGFHGTYTPGPVTLEFKLSDDPDGQNVLATTQSTNTYASEDQPQSPVFEFDPIKLDARKTYTLSYKVLSGGPIVFAAEQFTLETSWDDYLPLRVDSYDALGGIYAPLNLELYEPDTTEKRDRMADILDKADYIVIPSNRALDSMPRLPLRYPMTLKYYQTLFNCTCDGNAIEAKAATLKPPFHSPFGFDLVASFSNDPSIGPFSISDQLADESFTVYDHPKVMIFKKSADYSSAQVHKVLGSVDLSQVVDQAPLSVSKNPTNYRMPADRLAAQVAGGTWSALYNIQSILNRSQTAGVVVWYLTVLLLGLLFFPMIFLVFRSLPDRGYPFGRLIGILGVAWLAWMLASLKIAPFVQGLLWAIVAGFALLNIWLARENWEEIHSFLKDRWRYLIVVEGLFAALFLFSLMLRMGNP
ncbi:MAG: helix-hairpin-helix domain-containing protein, partial [Anaerolineaceae bacterium]|nr:helix-hairpin-helix domain-containing protein [Anaerolineaceae bacterium]